MRRVFWLIMLLLICFGAQAESPAPIQAFPEDELPEGIYLYSPQQDKYLPWDETENGNVYQIIGLAPHDTTVTITVTSEGKAIWEGQTISEGNGYFSVYMPAEGMDQEKEYTVSLTCSAYQTEVNFRIYQGSLYDFALDPLHIEVLSDLTNEEKSELEWEIKELEEEENPEELLEDDNQSYEETVQIGPNEYRNKEYSYAILEDGTVSLLSYYGHERRLVLPSIIDGFTVSRIDFTTHNRVTGVVTITIPSSVTEGEYAGLGVWRDLTAIYIPKDHPCLASVNGTIYSKNLRVLLSVPQKHPDRDMLIPSGTGRIEHKAFYDSTVRNVQFPDTLRSIGYGAFMSARRLRSAVIPDGVKVLEDSCFAYSGISRMTIPFNASVNGNICRACQNLKEIIVMPGNETVKSIDGVLFSADGETLIAYPAAKDAMEYHVPDGTRRIEVGAFENAGIIDRVILPESLVEIGWIAFSHSGLSMITLPSSLEEIEGSFCNCSRLKEFIVSADNPRFDAIDGKYLYSKDHRVLYNYPGGIPAEVYRVEEGTEKIVTQAFSGSNVKNVLFPDSLVSIGACAFFPSNITMVYIPGSVQEMDNQALSACYDLETVAIETGVKALPSNMFSYSDNLKTVSIPSTVNEIGELAFMHNKSVTIITEEGSFAHQYAIQNQLNFDVTPGKYEEFTRAVRDKLEELYARQNQPIQRIRIKNGKNVNIRQKPSLDSRRIGNGKSGSIYTLLELVAGTNGTWYMIELEDGTTGYIPESVAEMVEEDSSISGDGKEFSNSSASGPVKQDENTGNSGNTSGTGICTANGVNIRREPSMNAGSLGQINRGEKLTVLETQGEWSKIHCSKGEGYIKTKYIQMD